MKNFTSILFVLFTLITSAQSRLDSLVLKELNLYRVSLNLKEVTFSEQCYKISETHSKKLVSTKDSLYHSNNFVAAEVVQMVNNFLISNDDLDPELTLAKEIIKKWKLSEKHNKIMISSKYKFAGVSSQMVSKIEVKIFDRSINKFKNAYSYTLFSTMNFK
jgi:uncharacterized protein YkwD